MVKDFLWARNRCDYVALRVGLHVRTKWLTPAGSWVRVRARSVGFFVHLSPAFIHSPLPSHMDIGSGLGLMETWTFHVPGVTLTRNLVK